MFKVGDKVRYIYDNHNGYVFLNSLGVVVEIQSDGIIADWDDATLRNSSNLAPHGKEKRWWVSNSWVELVPEETAATPKTGLRYNQNKLRWRNFPMFLMKPLIEVAQYGETKYATYNFLDGMAMNDSLDSLKRHLEKFESPYEPDEDDESKINHLAHVAWNALVALHNLKTRADLDDRYRLPEEVKLQDPADIQKRGR